MWICLNNAFFSIVKHAARRDYLLVRSRWPEDIQRVWPDVEVAHTPQNDYPYRAIIERSIVSAAIANQVNEIDYTNFKYSAEQKEKNKDDTSRVDAYHEVWSTISKHGRQGKYSFANTVYNKIE